MFLPVNIRGKNVDSILTFIVNGIFGGSHPGFFPLNSHSFRCAWGSPVGESFPVKLRALCLLFWWRWAPSWGFSSILFIIIITIILGERLFWGY